MPTLSDFTYVDGVDVIEAEHINSLIASALRAEYRNVETIAATKTLTDADTPIQRLTPSGANRDVSLPTAATTNHPFFIVNPTGTSYNLVIKSGATTLATLAAGKYVLAVSDGNNWGVVSKAVETDATLSGDGTVVSPLSVVLPKYSIIIGIHSVSSSVPASTTYYGSPYKNQIDSIANQFTFPVAGVLKNLRFSAAAHPASGSLVITVQKNGTDTLLKATVPAGASAANYEDTTNSVSFAQGDQLRVKLVNSATATSASLSAIVFELEMNTVGV